MPKIENVHACCMVLGDRGLLISGGSGSGKTTLALALLGHARAYGLFARLVADDRVLLSARNGRLIGEVPSAIAGLAEAHGFAPAGLDFERQAVIDLAIVLVEAAEVVRFNADASRTIHGIELPSLTVSERNAVAAANAVMAALAQPPFG